MALFGGNGSRGGPKNLVEFKAGKMTLKGTTVSPDKRKGLVYIYQSDDSLTHFCWKDRKTGIVEDDLILFPDDCEYKKVTQCKEGSRVYLLKFKSSTRRLFFWMQEPKADKDDEYVFKVNDALNNPGSSSSAARSNGGSGGLSTTSSEQDMQNLLSSMTQAQLMQLIGGMSELGGGGGLLAHLGNLGNPPPPGVTTPPASAASSGGGTRVESGSNSGSSSARTDAKVKSEAPASAAADSSSSGSSKGNSSSSAATPAIKLDDLQKILSNIQPASPTAVDLSAGVSNELIQRITSNPGTVKKLAPLLPNFGGPQVDSTTGEETSESREVADTLTSPQFHSAVRAFCAAFPTGQLGPLVAEFKMGKAAVEAAEAGNLEAFINAIQQEADSQAPAAAAAPKDEPEDMNID